MVEGKKSGYETVEREGRAEVAEESVAVVVEESGGVRQTFRWSLAGRSPERHKNSQGQLV